jgi:hypothetical protein
MLMNGLGFVSRPLYLAPEFMAGKSVDILNSHSALPEIKNGINVVAAGIGADCGLYVPLTARASIVWI